MVGIGNREQAIGHLSLVGSLQEKLIALQGGRIDGPFVTAENIANGARKLAETLGYKTPGLFFQPPEKVAEALAATPPPTPAPVADPAALAAQAQIALMRESASVDAEIKRDKARADLALADFKARQWAEIERFKAGLRAELKEQETMNKGADPS